MIAIDLGVDRVEQALRLVRALGGHRYVVGRLHLVHSFALASTSDDASGVLDEARAWARTTLDDANAPDPASRDERLWRRSTDAEVAAVLEAFWAPGDRSRKARATLAGLLQRNGLPAGDHVPFDEAAEDTMHPLVVDAGWELLGLGELDVERHKGAIAAFGGPLAFEAARFEEETAIPRPSHLYELPAIGARELLVGADERGGLAAPFVLWVQGDDTYLDYVLRGVQRAAKLGQGD